MQHHRHQQQPHLPLEASAAATTPIQPAPTARRRGNYNCRRCGLPKKGHVCNLSPDPSDATADAAVPAAATTPADSSSSAVVATISSKYSLSTTRSLPPPPQRQPYFSHLRRALSFDDIDNSGFDAAIAEDDAEDDEDLNVGGDEISGGGLPASCLWEVLRRLPPDELLSAAKVCKGWRETTRRLWKAAEVLRLRVPAMAQVGLVGSMLHKCPSLVSLSLRMESDVDATMLACIAFSCPSLEFMEISMSDTALNRITGDELGRFVADRRSLKSLKMEGCSNLGGFVLCSTSVSTLWLSDLCSLSKMVFNCPSLTEISLEFARQENDNTDLVVMADHLGRGCPRLQNIHIASVRLNNAVVLSLTAAHLRELKRLSLVLGSGITDASVAAISSSFPNLELLDLSGSGISDSGIGMICNVFPDTITKLLVALCPNITSSGIQFATAQLPLLELMDCGMTICDPNSSNPSFDGRVFKQISNSNAPLIYQKLIIKHSRLKKLSLWGCSGLDALYLNCPLLNDLNLNSCENLHPERLLLQCSNLDSVHASGCGDMLVGAIRCQVNNSFEPVQNVLMCKRLADGSKRIRIQHYAGAQSFDDSTKNQRKAERNKCNIIVS